MAVDKPDGRRLHSNARGCLTGVAILRQGDRRVRLPATRVWVAKMLVDIAKKTLARAGYAVRRTESVPRWENAFDLLRRHNLSPKTIFDVGVATGTPDLYSAFPSAALHLFDPTEEALPFMQALARSRDVQIHNCALGEAETTMELKVRAEIGASSLLDEVGDAEIARRYTVPVKRFDEVVSGFSRPALVKIDVQGYELQVLKGMSGRLASLDAIMIEVSVISTLRDGPELRDVIGFLGDQGWSLAEIASFMRRPLDGNLAALDILFLPDTSSVRADRRWAAAI